MNDKKILVTGYNGMLGRAFLAAAGKSANVLVAGRREPENAALKSRWRFLDLYRPESFAPAVTGVDVVLHLASATQKNDAAVDVAGTAALARAARAAGVKHFVLVSIVGVDRVPLKYYRIKLASEQALAESGMPYTILRATQFHDFAAFLIQNLTRFPIGVAPRGFKIQPIAMEAVISRLLAIAAAPPSHGIEEIGGPEVLDLADLADQWLRAARKKTWLAPLPVRWLGGFGRALAAGGLATAVRASGTQTWGQWLAQQRF